MTIASNFLGLVLFLELMGSVFGLTAQKLFDKLAEWTDEELEKTAEAIGYGAVKYADLKNNWSTNYTFSFEQMLNDKDGFKDDSLRIMKEIERSNGNC